MCIRDRKKAKENCSECYSERNAECAHSDSERAITGLWTTAEMQKALEKGYKIIRIYDSGISRTAAQICGKDT